MSFIREEATRYVYSLIRSKGSMNREDVVPVLFGNQLLHSIPIAPFHVSEKGEISSEIIDLAVNDLMEMKVLVDNGTLRISKLYSPFEEFVTRLPSYDPLEFMAHRFLLMRKLKAKIGTQLYDITPMASKATRELVNVIPCSPEIGIVFSIPPEFSAFRTAIPLIHYRNQVHYAYLLAETEKISLDPNTTKKNLKKVKNLCYNVLQSRFSERSFDDALKIIFLSLLPLSSIHTDYICEKNHHTVKSYDNYMDSLTHSLRRCEECFSNIVKVNFIINNKKIFDDWRNGALTEWFVSSVFSKASWQNTLWNFEIDNLQCDSMAFDERAMVLAECKRTLNYGTQYQEGLTQIRETRKKMLESNLRIKTLFFTLVRDEPRNEKEIDVLITSKNYVDFVDNPTSYLKPE